MASMETNKEPTVAPACTRCIAARLADQLPPTMRARKASKRSLVALFAPGILFAAGLVWLRRYGAAEWAWLAQVGHWPWELRVTAVAGIIATAGGYADWIYHRCAAKCLVGPAE
jgi:hypothetical protein